jgi:hypothetical protein
VRFHAIVGALEPLLSEAVKRTGENNNGSNEFVVNATEGHWFPTTTDKLRGKMKMRQAIARLSEKESSVIVLTKSGLFRILLISTLKKISNSTRVVVAQKKT